MSKRIKAYGNETYKNRNEDTKYSSQKILGFLSNIIEINSAIDVGGGVGTWLSTCKELAHKKGKDCFIRCLDGEYINKNYLVIDNKEFIECNLENRIENTFQHKFDLAISLEVGEHLSSKRAKSFIEDLTKLSDIVLFSAAFPYQGGKGHINEQPLSYWDSLFNQSGFEAFDVLRPIFYKDDRICSWYRQNIIVFVEKNSKYYNTFKDILPPRIIDYIYTDTFVRCYEEIYNSATMKANRFVRRLLNCDVK